MVLVKRQTQSEDNFNGLLPSFEELAAMHDVDDAMYADEFMDYAAAFTGTICTFFFSFFFCDPERDV